MWLFTTNGFNYKEEQSRTTEAGGDEPTKGSMSDRKQNGDTNIWVYWRVPAVRLVLPGFYVCLWVFSFFLEVAKKDGKCLEFIEPDWVP